MRLGKKAHDLHVAGGGVEPRPLPQHAVQGRSDALAGDVVRPQQCGAHALLLQVRGELGKGGGVVGVAAAARGDEGGGDGGVDLLAQAGGDAGVAVADNVDELGKGGGEEFVEHLL